MCRSISVRARLPGGVRYNRPVSSPRVAVLVLLCVLTFLVGLGRPAITDSDEAFYAEAAHEMLERGDWVTPHYNGQFRFEKPIFYYWLAAVTTRLAPDAELGARLPSAAAGFLLVFIVFVAARRWYDTPTAWLAGAITGTSFGYVAAGRQALPDLMLACFITLATWAALVVWVSPDGPSRRRSRYGWLALVGAALAGGFLTKGPVALALPALVVGPLALWRTWQRSRTSASFSPWGRLLVEIALLVAVLGVLAAPWFAAMTSVHGVAYLDRFFIAENVERFATPRYNDPRPLWYYLPILVAGLLPWSPLMLLWAPPLMRVVRRLRPVAPVEWWLGLWAAGPLLFYSLSIGQQPRYILPVLPPLAILLARATVRRVAPAPGRAAGSSDTLLAVGGVTAGTVVGVLGLLVYRARSLLAGVDPLGVTAATGLLLVTSVVVAVVALRRQRALPLALGVASVAATLSLHYVVLSRPGLEPVEQMASFIRSVDESAVPYGRYRVFVRNLVFYVGRPHVDLSSVEQVGAFLRSPTPVLCVVDESDLDDVDLEGLDLYELGRVSYLNTGSLTLETLVWPDPETDLQTVLLVSNRNLRGDP